MNVMCRYKNLSQLKKNVLSGIILAIFGTILMLAGYPVYLHFVGVELFGLWATVSIVLTLSQFSDLGINDAIIKYTAEEYGRENKEGITEYIVASAYVLVIPSLVIIALLFLFNSRIVAYLELKEEVQSKALRLIPSMGILTVLIFAVNIVKGALMGIGRVDISNYIFLCGRFLQITAAVILMTIGFGVWALFYGSLVSYIFLFVVYSCILVIKYKIKLFGIFSSCREKMKNLITFGGTLFSARILSMVIVPVNKVFITKYIGLSGVTYYDIALRGAMQLRSLFEIGLKAIMPKVSEIRERFENAQQRISQIHAKGIKLILAGGLPLFLLVFILCPFLLKLWLGNNFNAEIVIALRYLLFAWFIDLIGIPSFYILMGAGRVKINFFSKAIRFVIHIPLLVIIANVVKEYSLSHIVLIETIALAVPVIYLLYNYTLCVKKREIE